MGMQTCYILNVRKPSWWFQPIWKNIRQIGSSPQVRVKRINIWNHHLETHHFSMFIFNQHSQICVLIFFIEKCPGFPIEHGDIPASYVSLPKSNLRFASSSFGGWKKSKNILPNGGETWSSHGIRIRSQKHIWNSTHPRRHKENPLILGWKNSIYIFIRFDTLQQSWMWMWFKAVQWDESDVFLQGVVIYFCLGNTSSNGSVFHCHVSFREGNFSEVKYQSHVTRFEGKHSHCPINSCKFLTSHKFTSFGNKKQTYFHCSQNKFLVGGYNPFEKYARQIGSFPHKFAWT